MLQSIATLIFAASAVSALLMIAASISAEWRNVRGALGLADFGQALPLPVRIRAVPARRAPMLRVTPGALQYAA